MDGVESFDATPGPPEGTLKYPAAPIAQIEDARRGFRRPTDAT
jgi:hypothetical protein